MRRCASPPAGGACAGRCSAAAARRPAHRRADHAGFTLVEVVLALVIFSFMTLLVYSAFFIGHRAVTKGEREAEVNQRMRLADDILARQVRSAYFYYARQDEDAVPFFMGRPDWMSFVSSSPQGRGGTGLAAITYRVVDGKLILEERAAFTPSDLYAPSADAPVDRAVLLAGASAIHFEYLPAEDTAMKWQPEWDARDEDTLPAAVRVTVEGLEFFRERPWVRAIPLLTMSYGWNNDEFQEPPDDEEDEDVEEPEDVTDNDDEENEGD